MHRKHELKKERKKKNNFKADLIMSLASTCNSSYRRKFTEKLGDFLVKKKERERKKTILTSLAIALASVIAIRTEHV